MLNKSLEQYPVLSLTGPCQSGKTTLVRELFADLAYFNLENAVTRDFAQTDPQAFLKQAPQMVIDEAQHAPDLFSYIQLTVDQEPQRRFVLNCTC